MRTSLNLDRDLSRQVAEAARRLGEKESTVYRLALRAGLPLIVARFPTPPGPDPLPAGNLRKRRGRLVYAGALPENWDSGEAVLNERERRIQS